MRRMLVLLLLTVAVLVELLHYDHGSHPAGERAAPAPAAQAQTTRMLTLLDVWAQKLVPTMLLQRACAEAVRAGAVARVATLERQLRRGLRGIEGFRGAAQEASAAQPSSEAARTIRAAGAAWDSWTYAVLQQPATRCDENARRLARLESRAVRLQQTAYGAVADASRAAIESGS